MKVKHAKCCGYCEYFDHECMVSGFCRKKGNKNKSVNSLLICKGFKKYICRS